MYRISQFSKMSELSVKALRYYDEENILRPSFRKEENQYRYYNDEDLQKARLIKLLRSLEFSIMEIKEVMENAESKEDLAIILQEKIKFIEENISREKELIEKISRNVSVSENCLADNHYPIETVEIGEVLVASIRFTGKYSDLDHYVPLLYKFVKNDRNGSHFNCYFDEEYVESADIELCLPIKKQISDKKISCKKLPGITALRTIHHGSYDTLYLAYRALFEYVNSHGITLLNPTREVYRKGPGMIFRGNPANYVTEILLPFEPFHS